MAERRMFTKKVTDSDEFVAMPSSAQALYLHLCMAADDDGFNNQVQVAMYKAHSSVDDVRVLLTKRFILQFESGVIVIKHWRMANALRKDRHVPTSYQDELKHLGIKENGAYTDLVAKRLPDGCQTVAVVKDSIDKNSIGKYSKENTIYCPANDENSPNKDADEVIDYLNLRASSRYKHSESSRKHIRARLKEGFTVQDCKDVIDKKCVEWVGTTYEKFLRPETLFGSKFENYLSAPVRKTKQKEDLAF